MKKSILALAVAAMCAFGFTACEDFGDMDLVGHINLTATNPVAGLPGLTQAYVDSTSLHFSSAMCNVTLDSFLVEAGEYTGTYDIHAGTVMVGTTQTLISNDLANLTFPLCGINLRDTVPGTYPISMPIDDFSFIDYLDTTNVNSIITTGLAVGENLGNVFAVAVSDNAFYLGYSGTITISSYGSTDLSRVTGTVNNVEAIYITLEQIEYLASLNAEQRASFDLATYLPRITFNGEISSMRADIDAVLTALEQNSK